MKILKSSTNFSSYFNFHFFFHAKLNKKKMKIICSIYIYIYIYIGWKIEANYISLTFYRHRWTGRYEAHLWDKGSWNVTQRKKGKQGQRYIYVFIFN